MVGRAPIAFFYNVFFAEIKENLVYIHDDNSEVGLATLLLERGVGHQQIVLAFHPPEYRQYTDFNPSRA
jgi:XisI protein